MSQLLPRSSSSVSSVGVVFTNEEVNDTIGGWLMVAQSIFAEPSTVSSRWYLSADTMADGELPTDVFSLSDIGRAYAWRVA